MGTTAARHLLLLACGLAAGCGGGDGAPSPGGGAPPSRPAPRAPGTVGPAPPPAGAATAAPDPAQRPPAPARLFNSRFVPYGGWWDELVDRLDPGHPSDPWPTEVLASVARRALEESLEAALSGDTAVLAGWCGRRFTAGSALRPAELESVRDDGVLVVRRGVPGAGPAGEGPAPAVAQVEALVAPYRGGEETAAQLWVTGSEQAGGDFETRCHLRLTARHGERRRQANVALSTTWRVAPKRVVLVRLAAERFEELELARAPFVELTGAALGSAAADGWLGEDALARASRTDNLVPFTDVYLGMHGLGLGDLDGDGLEDVYVARQGGAPNALLRHLPDGRVQDVAAAAGVDFLDDTGGVLIADLDGDGARDLALAVGADVVLCWNDGLGRFPSHTRLRREREDKVYTLVAADADGDGDLDLYDTRYFTGLTGDSRGGVPTPYNDARNGARNSFWRNAGERSFREDTAAAGFEQNNDRFSLAALWEDLDGDGHLDLYVVNDFGRNNLYRNDGGGHFVDVAGELGLADMAAGMGVTCADADLDGDLDLYVSNMFTAAGRRITAHARFMPGAPMDARRGYQRHTRGNTLLLNRGDGRFLDGTEGALAGPGGWSWGSVFVDFENDRLPDVVVPNGFITGSDPRDLESFFWRCVVNASPAAPPAGTAYENAWRAITRLSQNMGYSWNGHERNYAYWNLGQGLFLDASNALGLDHEDDTRVACPTDWDGDGRVDLWLKSRTAPLVRLLRNVHPAPGNWVAFQLAGRAPNTEAIGALVEIEAGGVVTRRRVYAGEGFLGCPSRRLHFGLGTIPVVERVRVTWPDGAETELADLPAGALYALDREDGVARPLPPPASLDGLAPAPLPARAGPPRPRVPALERLPYGPMPLPRFEGPAGRVADHAGRALLVYVWAGWDEGACDGLARLARGAPALAAAQVDVHPVALDGPRHEAFARATVAASGLAEPGGRADRRLLTLIELALQAVLPAYEDLPLPIGLLFDGHGRLCAVHVGEVDPGSVAADAAALAAAPDERGGTVLVGGRWLDGAPRRALDKAVEFLRRERGERELAEVLESFANER